MLMFNYLYIENIDDSLYFNKNNKSNRDNDNNIFNSSIYIYKCVIRIEFNM